MYVLKLLKKYRDPGLGFWNALTNFNRLYDMLGSS